MVLVGSGEKNQQFSADPFQLPTNVNQHVVKIRIAPDAKSGKHEVVLRATAMQDGKWPAVSETTVTVYVEEAGK
ncbi:hypothetical protein D3C83_267280 [compost metagenome]